MFGVATVQPLIGRVLVAQMAGLAAAVAMSLVVQRLVPTTAAYVVKAALVFAAIALVAVRYVSERHPFRTFGPANYVTTFRAALVALAAALIGEARIDAVAWAAAGIGAATTALDAVDGWLARRTSMASAFGARYDMELDALLIMVLAVIAWQTGRRRLGLWLVRCYVRAAPLGTGWAGRAGGRRKGRLRQPDQGSGSSCRRSAATAAIVAASTVVLLPVVRRGRRLAAAPRCTTRLLARILAVVLLDASITFSNVWPTPGVKWTGAPSVKQPFPPPRADRRVQETCGATHEGSEVAERRLAAFLLGRYIV